MGENIIYAFRGSTGFGLRRGIKPADVIFDDKENPKANPCRVFEFSNTGRFFAYCDSVRTCVVEAVTQRKMLDVELKRTQAMMFSPKDTLFFTWEPYTTYGVQKEGEEKKQPEANLRVWNLKTGAHLTTLIAQKQTSWKPQFSDDEMIAMRLVGSELFVHKNNLFEKYDNKLVLPKIQGFSISPGQNLHVACYMGAHGGQPASVQLRRLDASFTVVCSKTFFKSDTAKLTWNSKGTALLIMSVVEVDSTNKSYYGEQTLHLVNVTNGEACQVPLSKKGSIYAAKWNPNGREFAVCYGYMPAKVTFYNLRAEKVFETEEGPKNDIFFNSFGNILLVCGFGNLSTGKMEFWDVEKKKIIVEIAVPNTTHFEWAPDGQHFVTATTCPRLRIDNCYRMWHYTGRLLNEVMYESPKEELWQISFCPLLPGIYNPFKVPELTQAQHAAAGLLVKAKGDTESNGVPAGAVKKSTAYVPPHLRGGSGGAALTPTPLAARPVVSDKERKIKTLEKKVQDIEKLKSRQANGEQLELNQMQKLEKYEQLLGELEALRLR